MREGDTVGKNSRRRPKSSMLRAVVMLAAGCVCVPALSAQDSERADYFRAVAGHFNMPAHEVTILGEWPLPADEIPVVLFIARRSGVSPEAVVALRESGQSWAALTRGYRITPAALHVPIRDDAPAGGLAGAYDQYRSIPVAQWDGLALSDAEIIGLVNVRILSQVLRLSAEQVAAATGSTATYVELYAHLRR
jgi:hypothetical protein